jgi:predicted nucleic acid-binding protein
MSYAPTSSKVPEALVVDANLVVKAILPVKNQAHVLDLLATWHRAHRTIYAPDILIPEVVSVIRRQAFDRLITETEGRLAIEDAFRLGLEIIPSDLGLSQAAYNWASRLGHSKAYDGFYLAVAERLGIDLWTADERLSNRARQINTLWVRLYEDG